jgi:hypothetical protein
MSTHKDAAQALSSIHHNQFFRGRIAKDSPNENGVI